MRKAQDMAFAADAPNVAPWGAENVWAAQVDRSQAERSRLALENQALKVEIAHLREVVEDLRRKVVGVSKGRRR